MASIDLSQFKLTFDDEFNSLSLHSSANPNGTWSPFYASGLHSLNNEQEYYVDPSADSATGVNPFSVSHGVLTIEAQATPAGVQSLTQGQPYTSGVITTDNSFSQTYGYFEMRAQLPAGQGMWPAFWLLPSDHSWPPEIDAMEMLGNTPNIDYTTVHSNTLSGGSSGQGNTVADTSAGFHTYGVDWEPNTITWYFDGQQVYQTATPSDLNKPMYMLANLAVGGNWPGNVDGTTHFPADMQIDYVRAYASPSTVASSNNTAPAPMSSANTTPGADAGTTATASAAAAANPATPADASHSGTLNLSNLLSTASHGGLPDPQHGGSSNTLSFTADGHVHFGSYDVAPDQLSSLADLALQHGNG